MEPAQPSSLLLIGQPPPLLVPSVSYNNQECTLRNHTLDMAIGNTKLLSDLPALVKQALSSRRPLLHHCNADSSWLLQLPFPQPTASTKCWYNILIDPWLSGPQTDYVSFFSTQWHAIPPALGSIDEVEALCEEVERLSESTEAPGDQDSASNSSSSFIDAIVISREFTDHCNKATLLQCAPSIPVFATQKAARIVQGWKHFASVSEIPILKPGADWRAASTSPAPPWISFTRIVARRDALYLHSAVMIAFSLDGASPPADGEGIIYTPHGIHAPSLSATVSSASPPIKTLALLHGLHDVTLNWGLEQQINLGGLNGLQAQQSLNARYWIGTHDEVKKASGIVSLIIRRKTYTVQDALRKAGKEDLTASSLGDGEYLDIVNGESKVLA